MRRPAMRRSSVAAPAASAGRGCRAMLVFLRSLDPVRVTSVCGAVRPPALARDGAAACFRRHRWDRKLRKGRNAGRPALGISVPQPLPTAPAIRPISRRFLRSVEGRLYSVDQYDVAIKLHSLPRAGERKGCTEYLTRQQPNPLPHGCGQQLSLGQLCSRPDGYRACIALRAEDPPSGQLYQSPGLRLPLWYRQTIPLIVVARHNSAQSLLG